MESKNMDSKFKVGLIRVVTSTDQDFIDTHGRLIMDNFSEIDVESKCIPDQWEGIHDHETTEIAIPKIVSLAREFADKDMIIVSCADDPAVDLIKAELPDMPVTGGGETTLALAGRYSNKIGVIGITDYPPRAYEKYAGDRLTAFAKIEGVENTIDLLSDEGKRNVIDCAMKVKSSGCGVIALACTGLSTIGIAGLIEQQTGLPVIDPVLAEGIFAYHEMIRKKYRRKGD